MEKIKSKGLWLTAAASALSIALFSALYLGINAWAFSEAADKTEIIPASDISAVVTADEDQSPPDRFQQPALTVLDTTEHYTRCENSISPEEAAQIGAEYIWEMFDEAIDGMTVEMFYTFFPSSTRSYWHGNVTEDGEYRFFFSLDAITGERIDISRAVYPSVEIDKDLVYDYETAMRVSEGYAAQSDDFFAIAEKYARKHFNNTEVKSVEFEFAGSRYPGMSSVVFAVTDETGREATVVIDFYTRQMTSLSTQFNDIVPGYDADFEGAVG